MKLFTKYHEFQIYKKVHVARKLAKTSFILSIITLAIITFYSIEFFISSALSDGFIIFFLFFYGALILCPVSFFHFPGRYPTSNTPTPSIANNGPAFNDRAAHGDVAGLLVSIIVSFFPLMIICTLSPFVMQNKTFIDFWEITCGAFLFAHIPLYIGCFILIGVIRMIKREPAFIRESKGIPADDDQSKSRRAETDKEDDTPIATAQTIDKIQALLSECGIKFFLKYYKQLLVFSLRDLEITEGYSSQEKTIRYTAAKRIIDQGMSKIAAKIILTKQEFLTPKEIQTAQGILYS